MIKRFYILLLAIVASVGMSWAQDPGVVDTGTKGGMSYTFYDNGLLEISGSGALPGSAFTNWNGGFGASVKNIRFAEDCEVYGLDYMWFACYTEKSQLETIEINSVTPIMFSGSSGAGITYKQDGAVTITITAPGIVDIENKIIRNYGSPVNMILNMPATTVFEKKWFSSLENYFAVTIPTGAKGHIPGGYSFTNPYDQQDYDHFVEMGHEADFWEYNGDRLTEGVDYTLGVESTFVITAENASQIFGQATVSFQAPTEASNSEWVLWRKSDLKEFSDMSSGDQKVCKDVTVKVNNGVYNTDSGFGVHFDSSDEDGVQFVAPEGKVFKRIVILNEYGTFSDSNWSYDGNYKKWSGSANTVGFEGDICGISLIEFEVEGSAPANTPADVMALISAIGTVEFTAECKAKIDAARAAFDALSAADKDLVTNIATLTQAEEAWLALIPDPVVLPTVKYAVCNVPDGWAVTANGDAVLPINGRYHIADGQTVVLTPPASTEVGSMTSAEEAGLLGAGTAEDPYLIYTVAHWNAVAAKVNDGTQAAPNCRQMANLDGVTTVMGNSESKPFKGIYDGNGFVFTNINLSITSGSNPLGLFGCVNDASAVVKNVVVAGGTVSSTSQNVGAIVGQLNGGTVQYCANYATVSSSYNGKVRMGGIVGWMRSAGGDNNRVNYCINYGNVSGIGYVGGITGSYGAGNVNYCQNHGSISSSGTDDATSGSAGGIIGWDAADDATKITYNHNGGNITLVKEHSYKPSRYIIANTNSNATSVNVIVPSSNSYLNSLTLTIGSTNYTGADLATHEPNAQALAINPEGITISGITYAYGVAAPIAPAPGTNPGTDPAKQSNKTWQFTMPSHNIGLTVTIVPSAVIELINELPNPVQESDLKLSVYTKVQEARAEYDALTAEQKALVEAATLKRLTDAEAAFAAIGGGGAAAGALSGKFTINEDGDQISFAKGNLQATTTDLGEHWTWGFAANQWDLIGNAAANNAVNGNKTVSENGTVDLFGWSTPTTYYGISNSKNNDYYSSDFREWGENITGAEWKTLNPSDWNYIIKNRADAADKHGQATVNGVNGYIFLPDEWELPTGLSFTAKPNNWTTNVYEGDDWTAMENAGALFLPMSPWRAGNTVTTLTAAYYWTSDYNSSYMAMAYSFQEDASVKFTGINRYAGIPVRLATAGGASPIAAAQAAVALINAIPDPVTLDAACVKAIKDAREAVTALGENASLIDAADMTKLTQAEAAYTALIQAGADAVKAKINNIPQPVTLKLATRDSIQAARAAYDALTDDQKLLVTNYPVLTAAEEALAGLNPGGGMPADALNGKFTINAGGDQIAFAKGNLQATTEDLGEHWTWSFAANQWNYLGIAVANSKINGNGTVSENGTVDLFGWSTAATYYGINNSYKAVDYIGDFVDWGPNMGAGWRTLTKDEWNYLIENNTKGRATVNDKNGYIFLPNDWSGPAFTPDPDNFTTNVYSGDDWTAMENAGAVFLPSGPARNGTYALIANDAKYCSSTSLNNDTSYVFTIYYNQSQSACTGTNRAYGCMVRLVTEGGGATPLDSAQAVKDLIDAIPVPVTLDDACVNAIQAARDAYNALSDAAKGALDDATVQKLTDAEKALKDLNQAEADKVIAKINNIPTPVELKLATRDSIQNARAAYDALNAAQQALVSNYQKLLDAEEALADLAPTPTPVPVTPTVWDMNSLKVGDIIYEGDQLTNMASPRYINNEIIRDNKCPYTLMKSAGETSYVLKDKDGSYLFTDGSLAITPASVGLLVTNAVNGDINVVVYSLANVLDSAQAVKDLIDAIPTPVEYPTNGPAIAAALVAYQQLSDAAKGALDAADVQKMTDAAIQYAALDAIAAIEAIPAEIVYDPAVKAAIETAREKYDALIEASKALVDDEVVAKLTNAEQAWADLVALIEHNVSYIGKDGELKHENVALLHIPNPAPDFNGYEFVRWDVKAGDFLEEGLRIKAVYSPIITTDPVAFDTLVYNGTAQTLIAAGVASDGHIEYRLNEGDWSAELPKADMAAAYVVDYKLVREGHEDYMAGSVTAVIAKAPVTYVAPTAVDSLVYNASNQTLIAAGQTNDGTFEYSFDPTLLDSWSADLPHAMNAGTYNVYFRVNGDMNHLDSVAATPVAVTIAKAELTATADDKNVIYGDAVPAYTVTYAGWLGDDDATVLTGDIAFACEYASTSNVGEYAITPSGVTAKNYTITFVDGKLTVSKAASSCEAPVAFDTLVYNGFAQTLIEAGLPTGGEMQYSLDTTLLGSWSTELPQAKDAGAYKVFYRVKGDLNHNDQDYDQPIELSIAQAALMITAEDKSVIYGDSVPEFTAAYEGWMNSDDASVVSGLTYTCEYAPTSNVGEYAIVPSGATAMNYAISYTNGKLTVAQAALMITAEDKSVIYGDSVPEYTATYEGWKNGDDASVVSGLTYTCEYAPTSNVGEYAIVPSGAEALNYAISYTNGKLTVFKGTLTITANDTVVIYGDEAPAFTASYSGLLNADDESVVSGLAFTTPYQPGSPVGTYAIQPVNATADNYQINFVEGTLTVNKAIVSVSGAEAQEAKFADGHTGAEVLNAGTLNGIKLNDPLTHVTTAVFSSAEVSEHLTITLFYELTGDAALLANYDLQSTSEVFTTEGVIIEPFLPNNDDDPEDKESKVQEGIEVYAYGYCEGDNVGLKYHLNSGNPDQYKIEFEDSRFADVDWTLLDEKGPEGVIYITVPVDIPTGDYKMTVTFRDSRFAWLESQPLSVTFHVNLPKTYVRPLFDNTIVLIDTCECFTDIQWYHRADASEQWQPISGANGHYLHVEGKLTGEYFVKAKMDGVETYTCEQTDMQTLYGAETNKQAKVKAYPNPVNDNTNVTIEGSKEWVHNLRIVNLMGAEMNSTTFEGDHTVVEMSGYPQGNYMISVDGIMVKVLKQ